jgi:hypothetical protein
MWRRTVLFHSSNIQKILLCYPKIEVAGLTFPGQESSLGLHFGRQAPRKERLEQLVNSYSEHLRTNAHDIPSSPQCMYDMNIHERT